MSRFRLNPEFTVKQVMEIEDRVANLVQAASTTLELLANGYEVNRSMVRTARVDLRRLMRWVDELRIGKERQRGR